MDFVGGMRIEVAGRFVGQHQLRPQHHRARDRDALLLAAREFGGPAMSLSLEPDQLQHLGRARLRISWSAIRAISPGIITFSSALKSASR